MGSMCSHVTKRVCENTCKTIERTSITFVTHAKYILFEYGVACVCKSDCFCVLHGKKIYKLKVLKTVSNCFKLLKTVKKTLLASSTRNAKLLIF